MRVHELLRKVKNTLNDKFIDHLFSQEPFINITDEFIIYFSKEEDIYVYGVKKNDHEHYTLEYTNFSDWLGFNIDQEGLDSIGELDAAKAIVWEMTFNGYSDESIEIAREDLERRVKNYFKSSKEIPISVELACDVCGKKIADG